MGLESIIGLIIKGGVEVVPRIVALITDLKGEPPTQAEIDAVWERHKAAYDTIMGENPDAHPDGD